MRALVVLALLARVAAADGPRTTPVGFDHTVHDRDVVVNGGEPIACAKCHDERAGRLVGRPSHAACFATCHAPAPVTPRAGAKLVLDAERLKLCTNCHAEATLVAPFTGRLAVTYPPYRIDRDFNIVIGHKQHGDFACTQCHDLASKKPPTPHARCAGCHDGGSAKNHSTRMSLCRTCHPAASGTPQPPELAVVHDSVTAVFSHGAHAARGGAGRDCMTCHAAIKASDETVTELPRPSVKDCARCHDGKQAFGTTVACTRCHDLPPGKFEVDRPDKRFAHAGPHAKLVAERACTACHTLDAKTGETAVAGHAACTECHADDFGARHPKKCGACHRATEPWRKLRADRPPPERTEFGEVIDHAKHRGACGSCHVTAALVPPRGHVSCTGSTCHAASGGPAPQLSACKSCHQLGLVADRLAKRAGEAWSVRLAFDHAPHQKDTAGAPLACTTCHTMLDGAVVDLPTPKKPTCAPCHDGKQAFKLTGTTCKRCHSGGGA